MSSEEALHAALLDGYREAKRTLGYRALAWLDMLVEHGAVGAIKVVLSPGGAGQIGFWTLVQGGRIDLTAEAYVLDPEFSHLFTAEEQAVARRRVREAVEWLEQR